MNHIPTIAFVICLGYTFAAIAEKLSIISRTMLGEIVWIVIAAILALVAANLAYAATKKIIAVYRWLRLKLNSKQTC